MRLSPRLGSAGDWRYGFLSKRPVLRNSRAVAARRRHPGASGSEVVSEGILRGQTVTGMPIIGVDQVQIVEYGDPGDDDNGDN